MTAVDVDAGASEAPDRPAGPYGWVLLAVGLLAVVGLALATGRHLWFYSDDWNILSGYHDGGLLEPFNGHLSLLPVLVFQATARAFGLGSYAPFRAVGLAFYLFLGATVFVYTRVRVGQVAGALMAVLVLLNASAVTNVAFPFLLNFSLPLSAMVWMWWFLDRATARDDVGASASLGVALASSGIGLLAAAAAGVELLWRRASLRRWAVMAPPVVLYVGWYAAFHAPVARGTGGPGAVVAYAGRMVLGGFSSLVGNWRPGGVVLAAGFVVLLGLGALRWRTFDGRVVGGLAAITTFAFLTAWTRIGIVPRIPPDEPRYCWTIGAVVVLTAAHLLRGRAGPRVARGPAAVVLATLLLGAVVLDGVVLAHRLTAWDHQVRDAVAGVRTNLYAAELAGDRLDPDRILPLSFIAVRGRDYRRMVAALGSPVDAYDVRRPTGNAEQRRTADQLLVEDLGVTLTAEPAGNRCTALPPTPQTVDVPSDGTLTVCGGTGGVGVRVAMFGDGVLLGRVAPGGSALVRVPRTPGPTVWRVGASPMP